MTFQTNEFDRRTALHLALACEACHSGDADQVEAVLGIGPDRIHSRAAGDQYVDVCQLEDCTLIVFRGTVTLGGYLLTDADCRLRSFPGLPGRVHHGFASAFGGVAAWIEGHTDRTLPVIVTGHSMGGALALLCATFLAGRGYDVKPVYSFAAPRVGDADFAAAAVKQYRVINDCDPVPQFPWGGGYRHAGTSRWIDGEGAIRPLGVWQFVAELWTHIRQRNLTLHEDHKISSYVRALQRGLQQHAERATAA